MQTERKFRRCRFDICAFFWFPEEFVCMLRSHFSCVRLMLILAFHFVFQTTGVGCHFPMHLRKWKWSRLPLRLMDCSSIAFVHDLSRVTLFSCCVCEAKVTFFQLLLRSPLWPLYFIQLLNGERQVSSVK